MTVPSNYDSSQGGSNLFKNETKMDREKTLPTL